MNAKIPSTCRFPDLPLAMSNGVGARVGNTVFAGLGSAGRHWFSLDLTAADPRWMERAHFPAAAREQARAVAVQGQVYVFGGAGRTEGTETRMTVFADVFRYDPVENNWHQLATTSPVSPLAGALWSPDDRQILCTGGANKGEFERYFAALADAGDDDQLKTRISEHYLDRPPMEYAFNDAVFCYTPSTNSWLALGKVPFVPTAGAAFAVDRAGRVALINGEIKPGLRSSAVHCGAVTRDNVTWEELPELCGCANELCDGLAGAYAGYVGDALIVAGGTNFPGSRAAFVAGNNWAHRGLTKTWHSTIFALVNNRWHAVGDLPEPKAAGLAFALEGGLLLVGGELPGGTATASVTYLAFDCQVANGR
jgi:N-acetylneuraminate epimerase